MRIIFISIFTALLLCPAPDVAHAQHELQFGMQAIRMNSGAAKILSQAENVKKKSQQTAAPVKTNKETSQMDAIWQKYKAIDKGQLTSQVAAPQKTIGKKITNSHRQITNPILTTKDTRKAQPFRANQIIDGYKKAQESRQQMRSLQFKPPKIDTKDYKNEQ